jgi:hypothetical protein
MEKEFKKDIIEYLKKAKKPRHYVDITNYIIKKHKINPQLYYENKRTRFKEVVRNAMQYYYKELILISENREDIQGAGTGFFYFRSAYEIEQTTLIKSDIKKRDYEKDLKLIKDGKL